MKQSLQFNCFEEQAIKSHPLFRHLRTDELKDLQQEAIAEQFKRGFDIYEERHRIKGIYFIQKGIIKIYKTGTDGKEQIIRFAKSGDIIGFRSVLSNELACTSAKVIEDSLTCYISGETFINLIRTNGDFSVQMLQLTCRELGEANAYITDIAQKSVRERLAEILIQLETEFGLDDDHVLKISLTREELANIIGTATESVIRLLSEFKHDKLLELNSRKIKILNHPQLVKISNVLN